MMYRETCQRLKGKVAVVTGAASGMGKASAELFARHGAAIVVADRDGDGAERVAAVIRDSGGIAMAVQADVTLENDVRAMVKTAVHQYGRIDVLFNNAGVPMPFTPVEEVRLEDWERIMDVNVKGVFLGCREVVPYMKQQGSGVILNTASTAGIRPRPGLNAYCTSKGAVIALTKSLALELAPWHIRVNCLNPVATDTPMLNQFIGDADIEAGRQRFLETVPLGRLAQPDDIAHAALFLASDEADLITGVALEVDGGRCV
jgi:3-oxoacyl-[acyl-carrier protein] reductase